MIHVTCNQHLSLCLGKYGYLGDPEGAVIQVVTKYTIFKYSFPLTCIVLNN